MSERPLIAHIVFRLDYGGLENGVVNLVNAPALAAFRHAVIALTEATEFKRRLRDHVPVFAIGKRPGKDLGAYWRLFKLLRALGPAVVHTRNMGTLDCAVVALLAGVPVRIHGEHGWDVFDPDGTNPKYRALRRLIGRCVHVFVTVSADLRKWLVSGVGIPEKKVIHIYNGVDTTRFAPDGERESAALPANMRDRDSVIVGTVTRFSRIKDPLNLVEAFIRARARPGGRNLRLVMVGDGELRPEALDRLDRAGAKDAAWLPGSRDDVPSLLRSMDIFVLTSLREGVSNTILEAMASGLPVIATETGGNTELVVTDTGVLVPPSDPDALAGAILGYAGDAALRRRHGEQGRARAVSLFSMEAMQQSYKDLYLRALATTGA